MVDSTVQNETLDLLSDSVDSPERPPCLDDLLADNLTHGDLVVIDGVIHKFQHKEKRGPHIFFDTVDQKTASFWTGQLIAKMNDGSYIRPGADGPSSEEFDKLDEAGKQRLRLLFGCVRGPPRSKAKVRWLYVSHFVNRIGLVRSCGETFARNEDNAAIVVAEVDEILAAHNRDTPDPKNHLIRPRCIASRDCTAPRTLLQWVANEIDRSLGEVGQVHGNSVIHHERQLPQFVFDTIAVTIREAIDVSGKLTPQKVLWCARSCASTTSFTARHIPFRERLPSINNTSSTTLGFASQNWMERRRQILNMALSANWYVRRGFWNWPKWTATSLICTESSEKPPGVSR